MRFDRDGYSVEAALAKGRELPQWYLEEPPHGAMDYFYLKSFWALNTCRSFEAGPIPWHRIVEYGYHAGLEADIIEPFVEVIRFMDHEYLRWQAEEAKRRQEQRAAKKS